MGKNVLGLHAYFLGIKKTQAKTAPSYPISHYWLVIDKVHTDVKITYNTKMNHIMVSFADYCNSIFIDRAPYKHKNW